MKILIIGGTRFQGKFLVSMLVSKGHEITVFHRGIHPLNSNAGVKEVLGDRDRPEDLNRLLPSKFDWLIDTCAYRPEQCVLVNKVLCKSFARVALISTAYVYNNSAPNITEDSELLSINSNFTEPSPLLYGVLKIQCELEYLKLGHDRVLILRPGVLIGPGDHTFRLQFWIELLKTLEKRIYFLDTSFKIQLLDVRDLVDFLTKSVEKNLFGIFNLAGIPIEFTKILQSLSDLLNQKVKDNINLDLKKIEMLEGADQIPYCNLKDSEDYISDKARLLGFRNRDLEQSLKDAANNLRNDFEKSTLAILKEKLATHFKKFS
jgi:2'-hydroxyisoflavone reductase